MKRADRTPKLPGADLEWQLRGGWRQDSFRTIGEASRSVIERLAREQKLPMGSVDLGPRKPETETQKR